VRSERGSDVVIILVGNKTDPVTAAFLSTTFILHVSNIG
jgi:hypothetical protein